MVMKKSQLPQNLRLMISELNPERAGAYTCGRLPIPGHIKVFRIWGYGLDLLAAQKRPYFGEQNKRSRMIPEK
jgi:hypothetical protein